ncbi:hypothetical protein DL95DRAFT_497462 [Leptodontidium sp. 2 PMI_412]|nr:hypothetical protein DL95DRAFT_497462 [Leptodontidium sp. 2 PMI_412]
MDSGPQSLRSFFVALRNVKSAIDFSHVINRNFTPPLEGQNQEDDGLHRLFGVLKETELARLKYIAIDEGYLRDGLASLHSTIAGLKNALRAMTNLREMIVVRDITTDTSNNKVQMAYYAERKLGQDEAGVWGMKTVTNCEYDGFEWMAGKVREGRRGRKSENREKRFPRVLSTKMFQEEEARKEERIVEEVVTQCDGNV